MAGQDSLVDSRKRVQSGIKAHGKNDVGALGVEFPVQAKGFPDNPFDPVSFHGSSDLSMHADPDSAVFEVVGVNNQGKSFAVQAPSLFIHQLKLPSLSQQMMLAEFEHLAGIRLTAACVPGRGEH